MKIHNVLAAWAIALGLTNVGHAQYYAPQAASMPGSTPVTGAGPYRPSVPSAAWPAGQSLYGINSPPASMPSAQPVVAAAPYAPSAQPVVAAAPYAPSAYHPTAVAQPAAKPAHPLTAYVPPVFRQAFAQPSTQSIPTPAPNGYAPRAMPGQPTPAGPSPYAPRTETAPWTGSTGPAAAPTYGPGPGTSSPFDAAMSGNCCGDDGCGTCDDCAPCRGPRIFGGLAGLYMTRDRPNGQWLAFPNANPGQHLLTTRDGTFDWRGGYEARLGYVLAPNFALEGVYWWLDPFATSATVNGASDISSNLVWGGLQAGGTPMANLFNNAQQQVFSRRDEVHNVEVNLLQQHLGYRASGITTLIGGRYFRWSDAFSYASAAGGTQFGQNNGTTSGFYDVNATNNLIGGQVGAHAYHYILPGFRLYATPKFGVYANQIDQRQQAKRGDGLTAFDISGYKTDVAMLGQLDVGASWQVMRCLSLFVAYRGVAVTGIALSDSQIPRFMTDTDSLGTVNSNGSLILHGGILGGQLIF